MLIMRTNQGPALNNNAALNRDQKVADAAVMAIPGLLAWYRPDEAFVSGSGDGTQGSGSEFQFRDLISGRAAIPMSDTGPQRIASAFNGRPCLRFNAAGRTGRFYVPNSADLWPGAADVSIVYVAKATSGVIESYIGTDAASNYGSIQHNAGGTISVASQTTPLFNAAAPGDANPHFGLWSYDFASRAYVFQINGATKASGVLGDGQDLLTGNNVTFGQAGNAQNQSRGDFYEALFFSRPLCADGNGAFLTALNEYRTARYGL